MDLLEATEHAKHFLSKNDTVIVTQDGTIYLGADGAENVLKNNPDAIVVKGNVQVSEVKSKSKKDTNTQ